MTSATKGPLPVGTIATCAPRFSPFSFTTVWPTAMPISAPAAISDAIAGEMVAHRDSSNPQRKRGGDRWIMVLFSSAHNRRSAAAT